MKLNPYRNADYLAWVRRQGCLICGQPAEAHHVRRLYWGAGTGIRSHDFCTLPLCREHHTPETEQRINVEREIIELLMRYIETKGGLWK